jgi:hypothetical protein
MMNTKQQENPLAALIALLGGMDRSGTGEHSHKCNKCGFIWSHEDSCVNDTKAHTCRCGKEQWYIHHDHKEGAWQSCARSQRSGHE